MAPRLISYKKEPRDHIVPRRILRSYRTETESSDRIIHGLRGEGGSKKKTRQSNVSAKKMKSERNMIGV